MWLEFTGDQMIVHGGTKSFFKAVSGKPTAFVAGDSTFPVFNYGLSEQSKADSGPLPSGQYKIRLSNARVYEHTKTDYGKSLLAAVTLYSTPSSFLDKMDKAWGKTTGNTGRIIPILSKNGGSEYAFGRSRCWIHGSSNGPGSIGCIDMLDSMDAFIAAATAEPDSKSDIPLVVHYSYRENFDNRPKDNSNVA